MTSKIGIIFDYSRGLGKEFLPKVWFQKIFIAPATTKGISLRTPPSWIFLILKELKTQKQIKKKI